MIRQGILNPQLLHLLARFRHTNLLVIADRGFPFWPMIETLDLSLVDGIPRSLDVLAAVRSMCDISDIYMAQEFKLENTPEVQDQFARAMRGAEVHFEPHVDLKLKVPRALGLIRTGETIQYANMILVSGRV